MVQKTTHWNISQSRGEEIMHKYIIEILKNNKSRLLISDLLFQLNKRTKHYKFLHNKKRKPLSVFIQCFFGTITKFLDTYIFYKVIKEQSNSYVELLDRDLSANTIPKQLLDQHKDWVIVNEDDDFYFV